MNTSSSIDRRTVLRRLGHAGLILGGAGVLGAFGVFYRGRWAGRTGIRVIPDFRVGADPRWPALTVARGPDPARLVRAAVDAVGGIGRFVSRGDAVLVKPNMGWDRTAEQGANTHPAVVAEIVRLCREAGARRVIVGDGPVHDAERVAERSGIRRAAGEAGAEVVLAPGAPFVPAVLGGVVLKQWDMLGVLFDVNKVINAPVVKDHALSLLTCGFKNWYGLLGGTRARLHQEIDHSIADLGAAIRPTLTVVDATRIMIRGGPTGGRLDDIRKVDAVAAGTDPVALDAWSAKLLDLDPAGVPYIPLLEQRGLGSIAAGSGPLEELHVGA